MLLIKFTWFQCFKMYLPHIRTKIWAAHSQSFVVPLWFQDEYVLGTTGVWPHFLVRYLSHFHIKSNEILYDLQKYLIFVIFDTMIVPAKKIKNTKFKIYLTFGFLDIGFWNFKNSWYWPCFRIFKKPKIGNYST